MGGVHTFGDEYSKREKEGCDVGIIRENFSDRVTWEFASR